MAVTGCGGGGSSSPADTTNTNSAPNILDPGALSILEGATSVTTLSATDADSDSLTFSIISSDDQSLFTITSAGVLSFTAPPDFETPSDANADNVYLLSVQVSDGALSDNQSLTVTVTDAFEGRVVDAPIAGAAVFIDLNGNSQIDANEPSGTTDANGYFNIEPFTPVAGIVPKIISIGGTDSKTGKALPNLALVSDVPADLSQAANVTPLTMVLSSVDTPEAKAQVLIALGISGTPEELLTTDGWAEAEAGDEDAKAAQRINQQLGLLLQTATTLTDDGDADTDVTVALAQSVAKQVSTMAESEGSVDLTSPASIQAVLTQVAAEATPNVVIEASAIAAVATSVANVNTVVDDPTLDPLSDMAQEIAESAQENLQTSVAQLTSGEVDASEFLEDTSSTELFVNVVVAVDAPDNDNDGIPDSLDSDDDNDGVRDSADVFPKDSTESIDTDADGTGNNADTDDDGDGVLDGNDAFPLINIDGRTDTDGDGLPNDCDAACQTAGMTADTDDDGDGVLDGNDAFPLISLGGLTDTDGDGLPNDCDAACQTAGMTADTDDDGDGVLDGNDAFPLISLGGLTDTDGDGLPNDCDAACQTAGMTADTDDDGDGVLDGNDAFPLISLGGLTDTDGDGLPNDCDAACQAAGMTADTDDDGDGVLDGNDAFPLTQHRWAHRHGW